MGQMQKNHIYYDYLVSDSAAALVDEQAMKPENLLDSLNILLQATTESVQRMLIKWIQLAVGKTESGIVTFEVRHNGRIQSLYSLSKIGSDKSFCPYSLAFWKLHGTGASMLVRERCTRGFGMISSAVTILFDRHEELIVESESWEKPANTTSVHSWVQYRPFE